MDAPGATEPAGGAHPEQISDAETSTQDTCAQRNRSESPIHSNSDEDSESHDDHGDQEASEGDEEEEDDDEPHLKYAHLTKHLGGVYRNGDATSSFLAAGDKMV